MGGSVADPVTTILLSNGRFSRSGRGGSVPCPAFIFPSGGSFSESGRGGGGAGFFDDGGGGGGFFLVSGGGGAAGDDGAFSCDEGDGDGVLNATAPSKSASPAKISFDDALLMRFDRGVSLGSPPSLCLRSSVW